MDSDLTCMSKYWRSPWPRALASNKSFKSLPCQVFTEELGNWNGHDLGINPMSREVSTLSRSTITTSSTPAFYYILCTQTNYCFFEEEDPLFYLVIFKSLGQLWKNLAMIIPLIFCLFLFSNDNNFWADQNSKHKAKFREINWGFIDLGLGVWSDEQVKMLGYWLGRYSFTAHQFYGQRRQK